MRPFSVVDLFVNVAGIYVCYIYYALLQEKLTSKAGGRDVALTQHLYLMLVQCIINALAVAGVVAKEQRDERANLERAQRLRDKQHEKEKEKEQEKEHEKEQKEREAVKEGEVEQHEEHKKKHTKPKMPELRYATMALTYIGGMISSYSALAHISFPTQVLLKSCKMLPVMFVSVILYRKSYSKFEYLCVFLVSLGIYSFFVYGPDSSSSASSNSSLLGVALSFVSLFCDGLTGAQQDKFIAQYRPSAYMLMFKMNVWAVVQLFVAAVLFTDQLSSGFALTLSDSSLLFDLIVFGLVSAAGQIFIFRMVTNQGALLLALTTSSRKFFTILASVVYFGHHVTFIQWCAVLAVFAGLIIDIAFKTKKSKHKHKPVEKKE